MELEPVGLLLYWCEGSKREEDRRVEFVNSNPQMISIFLRYLRSKKVEERRIRIRMTIHLQDSEVACKEFWERVTKLRDTNFLATIVKRSSRVRKPLPFGTVTIRYNSLSLLRQIKYDIMKLIEGLS